MRWAALRAPALVTVTYYLGAQAGLGLRLPDSPYSLIWPPNAILLTALLLAPPRRWWIYLVAGFPAHVLAHPFAAPLTLLLVYLHNVVLALLAASLVLRATGSPFRLDRLRDLVAFVVLAGLASPSATSTVSAGVRSLLGTGDYDRLWWLNFFSNTLAILLLVPPLTAAWTAVAARCRVPGMWRLAGVALPVASLSAACVLALSGWGERSSFHLALLFSPLPFLLWIGVRFGPAGAGASLAGLAMAAGWAALRGHGPFAAEAADDGLVSLQSLLLAVTVPVLFVAALHRERGRTEAALRSSEARNRAMLAALPDIMFLQARDGTYLDFHAPNLANLLVSPEGFLGKRMEEVLPPALQAGLRRCMAEALETGGPSVFEYPLVIGGEVRHFEARVVRCGTDAVLSIVRDITARRDAEAAVAQREEALRRSHAQAQALARRLITSQEEERRRIARDLHDDLGQQLAAFSLAVSRLAQRPADAAQPDTESFAALQERIATLADGLRTLSHQLHPAVLEYAGLAPALRSHCDEVRQLTRVSCRVDFEGEPGGLPPEVSLGVYRVAQEALRNVVRHARTAEARISVTRTAGELRLVVRDEGAGFDPRGARRHRGMGLISMEERVHLLGGTLRIHSKPGAGTEIEATIPLAPPNS